MERLDLRLSLPGPAGAGGREWMVTNGLGGYASGRLGGGAARRHDGLLVAALPGSGRTILLDRLDETVHPDGGAAFALDQALVEVRFELGLPVWRFARDGIELERRLVMPWRQNTTLIAWRRLDRGGARLRLALRPWLHMRGNDGPADRPLEPPALTLRPEGRIEITQGAFPPLRLRARAAGVELALDGGRIDKAFYQVEAARDYSRFGPLWSPGLLLLTLDADGAELTASAESWAMALAQTATEAETAERGRRERLIARADPAARDPVGRQLVLAADGFLFAPRGRDDLDARVRASGETLVSVIAGYPWFNDWGRDTMIALEGLTLVTGRPELAGSILLTFAAYERDGLIPNNIPDGGSAGVYRALDASLWFFHALDRTLARGGDRTLLPRLLPVLQRILAAHQAGIPGFGIGVDPADGLLCGRDPEPGHMLTWMDSATPRRGKPVEINALWHNALCLMTGWLAEAGDAAGAESVGVEAARVRDSFNRRFWNPATGFLFDLLEGEDGDDPACRPNQLLALSLPHPVLAPCYWRPVLDAVVTRLWTPVGVRSLAPESPDYYPSYLGDLHCRDTAYHRGTVWPWLVGPLVDAWLRVHPDDRAGARHLLGALPGTLAEGCVGTLAEVFDGAAPHLPRGCPAQAWSVAETLRAWTRTGNGIQGPPALGGCGQSPPLTSPSP
ncbi:amylo-alpha-1,6-glucosidase [Phaeospirillum tilakii]|uniref:Amylo-alpha-1,6-glucosidase n=1 Tax=Phaeospirillum tilakii TaxID=741673 RepID=A0ABW5CE24_9PROT